MFYLLTCLQIGAVSYVLPLNLPSYRRCLYISRNNRGSLPLRGGRWREAPDEGGWTALTFCYAAFKRTLKCVGTAEKSLPPGGEGVAPATDEGETGERSTKRPAPPCVRVSGWRMALRGTFKQRRSRLLAPRQGDGVRCAALFGCRIRFYTRCAASLRMTRG